MMASFSLSTTTFPKSLSPHRYKLVSCNAAADDHHLKTTLSETQNNLKLPKISPLPSSRRNLLLGLYGAANLPPIVLADPIAAPDDINDCVPPDAIDSPENALRPLNCCPPPSENKHPTRYVLPDVSVLRVRVPAHKATPAYIEKYQKAVEIMKGLDDDDPHSWKNQGKIHCAYCNDVYNQGMTGHPELKIQIHHSSLFYPFHRWYLYFHERILGKLIDDPTFALPYWNWDNPDGMMIPSMYACGDSNTNSLFDGYRQLGHQPPARVDLTYTGVERSGREIDNLNTMKKSMKCIHDTNSFFGTDPRPDRASCPGSVENWPHNSGHLWTGDHNLANWEDMGNFYSAGYDPIFFAHHANVDRMWSIWKDLKPGRNHDPTSNDWLKASYVFYDENKELVRVYNEDCVDTKAMGYVFAPSDIPWEYVVSTPPRVKRLSSETTNPFEIGERKAEDMEFPLKLDRKVKVLVKRPATNRTKDEKEKEKEMLFVNGIRFDRGVFVKFDVLVNDADDGTETTPAASEFAGTFIHVPHNDHGGEKVFMTTGTVFGITELLEDIEGERDEYVLVSLVPWAGTDDATVSAIKIDLIPMV